MLKDYIIQLELNHLPLPLLVSSQLKVLASLQSNLGTELAVGAFQPQDDLLGSLGLLSEDRLGLAAISLLFPVITTPSL